MKNSFKKILVSATLVFSTLISTATFARMPERIQVPELSVKKTTPVTATLATGATESTSTETPNNEMIATNARQTDESIIINIKRIIADRSKKSINDIEDTLTLAKLGLDDVDAVLIMTDLQYFFDISYDEKTATELSKSKIKVSAMIAATMGSLYP